MNKTDKLKHIILSKYNSIREFSKIAEIPSTTLTSALDKGIGGMAVDRIIKICDVLNIDIKTFEPLENISQTNDLSKEETTLLENYNKSNSEGKKMIVSYSDYVSQNYADTANDEITATKANLINTTNNKEDDEEVFVPYKSFDELGAECNAAHADDLTPEKLEHAKQVILKAENEFKLAEWNRKHNK